MSANNPIPDTRPSLRSSRSPAPRASSGEDSHRLPDRHQQWPLQAVGPHTAPPWIGRLLRDGSQQLSNVELLAVLLRGSPADRPALDQALSLLERHRGSLRSITRISAAPVSRAEASRPSHGTEATENGLPIDTGLQGGPDAGDTGIRALLSAALEFSRRSLLESLGERPLIDSPAALRDFLALWLRERPRECFAVLFLDSQNRLICAEEMFHGSIAQTAVYPREIARRALETGACSIIVAHNHPSGVSEPSAADRRLTRSLRDALGVLDLPVLDHLIIADNHCFSFAEAGLL